jgi:squalene-hopene/tetraprenyl-beta-curcumene cyclase
MRDVMSLIKDSVKRAQEYAQKIQNPSGFWRGIMETNVTMEAEMMMLNYFLGVDDPSQNKKLVRNILDNMNPGGSWGNYYGAQGDLSTTIEAYFALKLSGIDGNTKEMRRAFDFILAHGGIDQARVFTKIWLALFGQISWDNLPSLPPEIILMPPWFPLNIHNVGAWARATIVPLTLVLANRPMCSIPESAGVKDLYLMNKKTTHSWPLFSWKRFFYNLNTCLKIYDKHPFQSLRAKAIKKVMAWILTRQQLDGTWDGIQPATFYSLIALKSMGYSSKDSIIQNALQGLKSNFSTESETTIKIDAANSNTWDTCLMLNALLDSGLPPQEPAIQQGIQYLLKKQILSPGDWQVNSPQLQPGGWAFAFANENSPDTDDTAEVLIALCKSGLTSSVADEAAKKGCQWMLGMQSRNGGWAGYDKDQTNRVWGQSPFFDFADAFDLPSVDVTAHVLEALALMDFPSDHPQIMRGLDYIFSEQQEDGSWFGRWGVNYIYGTSAVLGALSALQVDMSLPAVKLASDWLLRIQNKDGGWGESCTSFAMLEYKGKGESTPSQTAWALIGLIAAGLSKHPSVNRGIEFLCASQNQEGTWDEDYYTGCALCRNLAIERPSKYDSSIFMVNYHLWRHIWPLRALGIYLKTIDNE